MKWISERSYLVFFLLIFWGTGYAQSERSLVVDSIEYYGNTKTRTSVIRNYLDIREGQAITREQLEAGKQRLQSTNFFKDVNVLILPGEEKGHARVQVKIRERHWPFLQFKSGFNELDGWYISPLGIRFDNIFGRGNIMGAELLIGDRVSGTRFEYIRPFLWNSEYDLRFQISGFNRDFVHFLSDTAEFRQNVRDDEFMIRLSGNSGIPRFFSLAWVAQTYDAENVLTAEDDGEKIPAPEYLDKFSGKRDIRRYIIALSADTRDRKRSPSRGWWGSVAFEQSAKQLGSFTDYTRFTIDIRRYHPLYRQLIGAVRVKWGHTSDNAPFYEKFYLGGPNSLRGYRDRGLTPPGYAANLFLGSAELRFPLSARLKERSPITGVLFYDVGYAWNSPNSFDTAKLKSGIGFGLRIKLPIVGLLRMDFAYPQPVGEFHLHFSLGHTF